MRILTLLLVACGGTSSDGSVDGRQFNGNTAWGQITTTSTRVVIEENVNVCQNRSALDGRRNTIVIELSVWNGTQLVPPQTPGVYVVQQEFCRDVDNQIQSSCGLGGREVPSGARYAIVTYTRDADVAANQALVGAVTVDAISATVGDSIRGRYELFLDTGDTLTGSFSADTCEI